MSRCTECGQLIGHNYKCPNASDNRKSKLKCSECGEGIYEMDEYIENSDGDIRHFECFRGMWDLANWLGYEVKRMNEEYE